jgi:hypothetical protein
MAEKKKGWTRRSMLKTLGIGTAAGLMPAPLHLLAVENQSVWIPKFWEEKTRPRWAWENYEDMMYHDLDFDDPEMMTAPEFFSFMEQVWVFNTAMEWHREGLDGCIVCYSARGDLPLTGAHQVSRWFSDPRNSFEQSGDSARFEKKSGRRRDCALLPAFQFHLGQNPTVEVAVSDASADWQFCVSIKGRSGPPFISTGWQTGAKKFTFDLARELEGRGYALNFAELHFIMGTWTDDPKAPASVTYRVYLPGKAAVVPSLPVIRTAQSAARHGVPVVGVALNPQGERLKSNQVRIHALVAGREVPLEERDGFWKGVVRDLKPGDYKVELVAQGAVNGRSSGQLRVTEGEYFSYDKDRRLVRYKGKFVGPLTGSYQGTFFFRDVGLPSEKLVNDQAGWDAWDRSRPPGEHQHYWEAVIEKELNARFAYLHNCGWDLLHLHQHWGIWERLDAGGRIAPHGAEQLALYLRVAARNRLAHIQSLSSYEYAVHRKKNFAGTPPWSSYVDAGFKGEDWFHPQGTTFRKMFHQYLTDFVSLFKEETALFGMTASGEGDHENGPELTNDVFHHVRSLDQNHVFLAEPLFAIEKLPRVYCQGFEEEVFGARTYFIADKFLPEYELGVFFKLLRTENCYLAEGSWPSPNSYTAFHYLYLKNDHKIPESDSWAAHQDPGPGSWVGTLRYRTRLRDTYYLGLIQQMPIMDTWDEAIAEDEHIILRQVRELVDWSQPFMEPEVVIRVNDRCAGDGLRDMVKYEQAFARIPLAYRYLLPEAPDPEDAVVLDGSQPFHEPRFQSEGGNLPDRIKERIPLIISEGYCASYLRSKDQRTLLAYVYNTAHHTERAQWSCGRFHRIPTPTHLTVKVQNLPGESLKYRLFDLNAKKIFREGTLSKSDSFDLGITERDYFLLVAPA